MELRRVVAALQSHWALIVVLAILGALLGAGATFLYNTNIEETWEAEAAVAFAALNASESESTVRVEDEAARTGLLLAGTLEANPRLAIQVDQDDDRLVFLATGGTADQAVADALAWRAEYQALGSTVLSAEQIDAALTELFAQIESTYGRIATLGGALAIPETGDGEPVDAETALRTALASQIAGLVARQAQLEIWIDNPGLIPADDEGEVPPVDELEGEFETNEAILTELRDQLATIPASTATNAERLELEALQAKAATLEKQYVNLFSRRESGIPGFYADPLVADVTSSERPLWIGALAGAVVGALLGAAIAIGREAARQPIRSPQDLVGVSVLGVVSTERKGASDAPAWYPDSFSVRRRDVQALRAAIDATADERFAVAITAVGDPSGKRWPDTAALAADVAASYAVAGREVLLIDSNPSHPADLLEYGLRSVIVGDSVSGWTDATPDTTATPLAGLGALRFTVADGADPADSFASSDLTSVIADAKRGWEVVVIACPDISEPLTTAVLRRIDNAVLVASMGKTTVPVVSAAVDVLEDRKVPVIGVALLRPGGRLASLWAGPTRDVAVVAADEESAPGPSVEADIPLWDYSRMTTRADEPPLRGDGAAEPAEPYLGYAADPDQGGR